MLHVAGSPLRPHGARTSDLQRGMKAPARARRQRCLAHRMRNLVAKVPDDTWPGFKDRVTAAYQAPSRAIARDLAEGLMRDYAKGLPSTVRCFEACIAYLRMPINHRRAICTTNLLERLFLEERRRLKVLPHAFG